jgi:hypothetical protein
MPHLRISTNVPKSAINMQEFSADLTEAVAETLAKPIEYCMVEISPDAFLVKNLY